MTLLLVDTSAWIELLRDTGSAACLEVARLLAEESAALATTPVVVMELLAGARTSQDVAALERLTAGLVQVQIAASVDIHAAAAAYRACRRNGTTVRGLVDCLLAVIAQRQGITVVHRDADLAVVCGVLGVAQRDLR